MLHDHQLPFRREASAMRLVTLSCPLTIVFAIASCGRASPPADRAAAFADPMVAAERAPPGFQVQQAPPSLQAMWAEQKLIRAAELRIEARSVPEAVARTDSIARHFGALLADTRITQDDQDRKNAALLIRVPVASFSSLLEALRQLGEVKADAVTTEDVTKAYADLETRLTVKEETAARLRRLLSDRTGKLSDVLEVERELSRVITELEQLKGERRYYDQRIAMSTISMTIVEPGAFVQPGSTAPIAEAFRRSLQVLSTSVAWLVYLVTFVTPWLVVVGFGWWLIRWIRMRRAA
ncbi:MAG: DUF4349 domain-containing protein [Gemmatimonadota bacterium]|nr:DUF4349 domain-containing protein [Gemmatimonadota bacterium]